MSEKIGGEIAERHDWIYKPKVLGGEWDTREQIERAGYFWVAGMHAGDKVTVLFPDGTRGEGVVRDDMGLAWADGVEPSSPGPHPDALPSELSP